MFASYRCRNFHPQFLHFFLEEPLGNLIPLSSCCI
jgi:hypothetical protein